MEPYENSSQKPFTPYFCVTIVKPKPVPIPRKTKLQGPQVETLVEQPPLMTETQSETEASDGDSVVAVTCVRKPYRVPVLSPQVDIDSLDSESVDLESDLDEGSVLVSGPQYESGTFESDVQDPSESIFDSEDHSVEPSEQSVEDSVSTVDHSGDNESSVAPTPVPAPRRSARTRTQGHLHPDFVYDMMHTSESPHESERKKSDLELQKIELLQSMINILK